MNRVWSHDRKNKRFCNAQQYKLIIRYFNVSDFSPCIISNFCQKCTLYDHILFTLSHLFVQTVICTLVFFKCTSQYYIINALCTILVIHICSVLIKKNIQIITFLFIVYAHTLETTICNSYKGKESKGKALK